MGFSFMIWAWLHFHSFLDIPTTECIRMKLNEHSFNYSVNTLLHFYHVELKFFRKQIFSLFNNKIELKMQSKKSLAI